VARDAIINLTVGKVDFERISDLTQRGYSAVLVSRTPVAGDVISYISWLTARDIEVGDFDVRGSRAYQPDRGAPRSRAQKNSADPWANATSASSFRG